MTIVWIFDPKLESIALSVCASRNLQSLELCFDYPSGDNGWHWSPSTLFASLDSVTLPFLHTFRADGAIDDNWYRSFNVSNSGSIGAFFTRHQGLRTISLGWMGRRVPAVTISPETVAALFPSVTHFSAPPFLCGPVIASNLADQLERLEIWDFDTSANLTTAIPLVKGLPKLRKLTIDGTKMRTVDMNTVKRILNRAPGLEEFSILRRVKWAVCISPIVKVDTETAWSRQGELLQSLQLTPELRILSFESAKWSGVAVAREWDEYVLRLAQICPKLQRVNNVEPMLKTSWDIWREDGKCILSKV
ncbi:hypothetical protein FS749_008557 [Ceratobasidium sp. UAMH 11750]|nr:hypothetical protein FS749_008557 [Ceratobasidium sp. UAMH 11750]